MSALRNRLPDVEFYGIGGETMTAAGLTSLFNISEISVMGITEVLPRLRLILRRIRQTVAEIERLQPDVVVTIDSWGFVASVLKKLRKLRRKKGLNIPCVHYVAPQVWAWKKGRAKQLPKLVDRLMTLLPYEPAYFEKYGLPCNFVGHPVIENTASIADDDSTTFRARHHIPADAELLCVLPGSRHSEIERLIPRFLPVIRSLRQHAPNLFVVIPTVAAIADQVRQRFDELEVPHCFVFGQQERYAAFRSARMAIAASGTVSLELTACGTPHLIAYTFSRLTNWMAEHLIKIRYVDLINILADQSIIPELLGRNCKAETIAPVAAELWNSPSTRTTQITLAQTQLAKLRPAQGLPSEAAAAVVVEMMNPAGLLF